MNPILRNILAVIAGIIVGSLVNMAIAYLGPTLIPPPEGADILTMEGLRASMGIFEPKHFLTPFLAHALGTLAGAFVAAKLGITRKALLALIVGIFFLAGGIAMVVQLPSPLWFTLLDLVVAYIPMSLLGTALAKSRTSTIESNVLQS